MTIEVQVRRLSTNVEDFSRCMASLDNKLFLGKLNGWSPRDILAHLIGWNRYVIEGSKQIINGKLPFYDIDPGENYSNVNTVLIREYYSIDKHELLDELLKSTKGLKRFLLSLDPDVWDKDFGIRHLGSIITIQDTVDELIGDYIHHRHQVEKWLVDRHVKG